MQMLNPDLLRDRLPGYGMAGAQESAELLQDYLACYGLQRVLDAGHRLDASCQHVLGQALFVQHYQTSQAVRGTVIAVHGYFDHSGLYRHLISYLLEIGYDVLIYDLPGHGLSEGAALSIDAFSTYAAQLTELIESRRDTLNGPWVMLGQSTGAAIVVEQQLKFGYRNWSVQDQILLAPLVRPCRWETIARQYRWLRFFVRSVPRQYGNSSHDQAFLNFVRRQDPLQHHRIPVKWIGAMLRWIDEVEHAASLPTQPFCIQGVEDATVEWRHNLGVLGRLYPGLDIHLLQRARHHLVNEEASIRLHLFQLIEARLRTSG